MTAHVAAALTQALVFGALAAAYTIRERYILAFLWLVLSMVVVNLVINEVIR